MSQIGLFVLAVALLGFASVSEAQERHLGNDAASPLCAHSAFAHGYIHGYEQGFHSGDLDLQLGRDPRNPSSLPNFKHATGSFRSEFGSKKLFKSGFEDGFVAGYSDAIHLFSFRALENLRRAANGLNVTPQATSTFDNGFHDGYENGRRQGANDGRDAASANPINPPCLGLAPEYCDAFRRAFDIGYDDGFHNQSRPRSLQASAK